MPVHIALILGNIFLPAMAAVLHRRAGADLVLEVQPPRYAFPEFLCTSRQALLHAEFLAICRVLFRCCATARNPESRSEETRVGKGGVRTFKIRWSPKTS